jgi:hypothetical protein
MNGCPILQAADVTKEGLLLLLMARAIESPNDMQSAWIQSAGMYGLSAKDARVNDGFFLHFATNLQCGLTPELSRAAKRLRLE